MSGDTIFREYRISDAERSDRSAGDRLRHRQKVRESIRENIADIIAEESIIGKNKDRVIKVPLRGIKEYRFVFGDNAPGASQGDGDSRPGQVVGKTGKDGQGKGDEQRRRPPRRRLLRDRRHARRTDRDHVRGSRAAQPRAPRAARNPVRLFVAAQRLPQGRHPHQARQAAHRQAARDAHARVGQAQQRCRRALEESKADREADADADVEGALDEIALEEGTLDGPPLDEEALADSPGVAAFQRVRSASRSIRTTCATSTSRSTPRKNPTPPSSASWTPRARWTR